jgi:dihydrofolate synthase / folylpolyglutamate synthase
MPFLTPQLEWLMATQSRGIHPGLHRMERLLLSLGNPERKLKCLHVAGTNGKGSVCAFADSVLRRMGVRTGLYTSPHLVDFSERIRIDGKNAASSAIDAGIMRLQRATIGWSGEEQPTFFELVTALAFDLFERAGCEVVVLETGLGGRLDATNAAPKIACALTPMDFDHTEWLGNTLALIAREKAGIMRPGVPVVISPQQEEAAQALEKAASERGSPCIWVREPLSAGTPLGLAGSHQRWNAAVALELVRIAGFSPSPEELLQGLAQVTWPGRFQRLKFANAELVLDGAHNHHAIRQLVTTWREQLGEKPCRLIFGALEDKDPSSMLSELLPLAREIHLVPVASTRSADPLKLAEEKCFEGCSQPILTVHRSLSEALGSLCSDDGAPECPVLLTGSLFLVGEALSLFSGGIAIPRNQ